MLFLLYFKYNFLNIIVIIFISIIFLYILIKKTLINLQNISIISFRFINVIELNNKLRFGEITIIDEEFKP